MYVVRDRQTKKGSYSSPTFEGKYFSNFHSFIFCMGTMRELGEKDNFGRRTD